MHITLTKLHKLHLELSKVTLKGPVKSSRDFHISYSCSAISSIIPVYLHKSSIVFMRQNVNGGCTGRGKCNSDNEIGHQNRALSKSVTTIAGNANESAHAL